MADSILDSQNKRVKRLNEVVRVLTLWLAALNAEPLRIIRRAPLGQMLTDNRLFLNVQQAVEAYQTR